MFFQVAEIEPEIGVLWFVELFDDLETDSACVDSTFIATEAMDGSALLDAVAILTDGREIWPGIGYRVELFPRARYFGAAKDLFSFEGEDFTGAAMESISYTLDELSSSYSDGVTPATVAGTTTIEGDSHSDPVKNTTLKGVKFHYDDG